MGLPCSTKSSSIEKLRFAHPMIPAQIRIRIRIRIRERE